MKIINLFIYVLVYVIYQIVIKLNLLGALLCFPSGLLAVELVAHVVSFGTHAGDGAASGVGTMVPFVDKAVAYRAKCEMVLNQVCLRNFAQSLSSSVLVQMGFDALETVPNVVTALM